MNAPEQFDVGILGAGPAGASLACELAKLGHRVALFHRARPVRAGSVLETLSPGALELLRSQDPESWPQLEGHFLRCATSVHWSRGDFAEALPRTATLIDRRALDPFLREAARRVGVTFFPNGGAISRAQKSWKVTPDQSSAVHCQFLVDAAGRHSGLPGKGATYLSRTLALTARIDGTNLDRAETRIEALAEAWFWSVRDFEANTTVTLFVAFETASRWSGQERERTFVRLLEPSSLSRRDRKLSLASRIAVVDATITERQPVCGDNLIRIGDAALALDPLASQGIHHALLTARYAATAINTTLIKGDAMLAKKFVRTRHAEGLHRHLSACRSLYRRQDLFDTHFWRARADFGAFVPPAKPPPSPGLTSVEIFCSPLELSSFAGWKTLPVLEGDFITRRRVLTHPGLSRPCAFIGNQPLSKLLGEFCPGTTGGELAQKWIHRGLSAEAAAHALVFLVRHRILCAGSSDVSLASRQGK